MRGVWITELERPPELAALAEPNTGRIVEMAAVSLNPLDLSVAAGRFYGGHPELPYVPGCEGVGRTGDRLVYVFGGGLGVARNGTLAERVVAPDGAWFQLPDDADPALAAVCGIAGVAAWAPVTRVAEVAEGDRVLVLGATGTVGLIAVQAAKLRGASWVVAAGRDPRRLDRARALGADAVAELGDDTAGSFARAFGNDGPTVVIDPLWGEAVAAASQVAAPGARIVQIGQSAGAEATFDSAAVRGKQLRIFGHSNFALAPDDRRAIHLELLAEVQAGRITIDLERFPLERIAEAWDAQGSGTKAVVEL
ncbi:MAG: zinc-binding alcohol dehydrogenase family protein [Gaiellaceae bacterium]